MASTEKELAKSRQRLWRRPGHHRYSRCKKFLDAKWDIWFGDWDDTKARKISSFGVCLPTVYRWRKQYEKDPQWRPWKTNKGRDRRVFTIEEETAISDYITVNWLVLGRVFTDQDFHDLAHEAYRMKYLSGNEDSVRDFHASPGFIADFKRRNGFSSRCAHPKKRPSRREDLEDNFTRHVKQLLSDVNKERIVNVDETFWRCLPSDLKTWGKRGDECVSINVDGSEKEGLTVVAAVTAARTKLPLSIIAAVKTTRCEDRLGDTAHHHKTHSESGWSTVATFCEYLMFIRQYFSDDERIWLILDLYSVHRTDQVRMTAKSLNIELIFIPPGQTDHFQPLDRAVFGVLKAYMRKLWREQYAQNCEMRFTKELAVKMLIPAWERVSTNVISKGWSIFEQ